MAASAFPAAPDPNSPGPTLIIKHVIEMYHKADLQESLLTHRLVSEPTFWKP